ncbi:hypothetical protein FB563_5937 [Streptomyces puniciscabiei]|uniref:Uncharacterized protein n=1 Tax=Streptomyces puniciscabiei TaxID=164348 RepID=A0A542UP07_9ACTN|nr:hypothetical protein [Streptomyces puniciscabiei]TQL00808.1 hypothetical protein FB563_5937 [Streptomyces puniciscabiei]
MTGLYALIRPDGRLEFRDGVPDQMLRDADPQHGAPAAFTIQRSAWGGNGLHGHVSDVSRLAGTYRPNHVATSLVAALGGPEEYIFGNLAICGSWSAPDNGEPLLRGLTEAQQDLIHDVHTAVSKEVTGSP